MTPTERTISHTILLVDDDEAVRDIMTAPLESDEIIVKPFEGGGSAWR